MLKTILIFVFFLISSDVIAQGISSNGKCNVIGGDNNTNKDCDSHYNNTNAPCIFCVNINGRALDDGGRSEPSPKPAPPPNADDATKEKLQPSNSSNSKSHSVSPANTGAEIHRQSEPVLPPWCTVKTNFDAAERSGPAGLRDFVDHCSTDAGMLFNKAKQELEKLEKRAADKAVACVRQQRSPCSDSSMQACLNDYLQDFSDGKSKALLASETEKQKASTFCKPKSPPKTLESLKPVRPRVPHDPKPTPQKILPVKTAPPIDERGHKFLCNCPEGP